MRRGANGMIRHNFKAKYVPLDAVEFIKKRKGHGEHVQQR